MSEKGGASEGQSKNFQAPFDTALLKDNNPLC